MSDAARPEEPAPRSEVPTAPPAPESTDRRMPSSQPILLRALRWGIVSTLLLIAVFGLIGWLVAGSPGLVGGVIGAAFSGLCLGLTIGSITFANRFVQSDLYVAVFFGIVLGTWLLKFIAFIVAVLFLREQPWLDPMMFFLALLSGVLVSLVIDVLVVTKSRMLYVSDARG